MPSFEECLQNVLEEIQLSSEDRQIYNRDAEIIRNHIMDKMKEFSPEFKQAFGGLRLTGSCLDDLKIDLPDEFDMDMILKMRFNLKPCADQQRPGFVTLVADDRNHRFIGRRGKMLRHPLQMWLRSLFLKTIGTGLHLEVNKRRYLITYPKCGRGQGVAHTVEAKEICGTRREISFDFVPAFEFYSDSWPFKKNKFQSEEPWFAIPFGKIVRGFKEPSNRYTFRVCASYWERAALHDKQNLKNSLRLMKALRDANGLKKLASYTLKSIYLQEITQHPDDFWEQPMGDILIMMLESLLESLYKGCLPFFLHGGFNQLNMLSKKKISVYQTTVGGILRKLKMYREIGNVELRQVRANFMH